MLRIVIVLIKTTFSLCLNTLVVENWPLCFVIEDRRSVRYNVAKDIIKRGPHVCILKCVCALASPNSTMQVY